MFLKIHHEIVSRAAAPMLHLLYKALQSRLSRGIILAMHSSRRRIYGEMMYINGL